jgi:hypothetical protein
MSLTARILHFGVGGLIGLDALLVMLSPPRPINAGMLGLCALLLVFLRVGAAEARRAKSAEQAPPGLEQLVLAAEANEERGSGLSCISIEFPRLVCPPDEFDAILVRHAALVRARLPALTFLARKETTFESPFDGMHWYAAEIDADGREPRLAIRLRTNIAKRYADFASIAYRAADFPGRECLHVVVMDDDAVSIRKLDLLCVENARDRTVRRELVQVRDQVTFEPRRQQLVRRGAAYIRRWCATEWSPLHQERFTLRPAAGSEEECLDRILVASEEKLREAIEYARRVGRPMAQALFWCSPGKRFGPHGYALAYERTDWPEDLFECWPQCDLALRQPWPPEWVPVFVTRGSIAGIRWMAPGGADESTRPVNVTEWKAGATKPPHGNGPVRPRTQTPDSADGRGLRDLFDVRRWP